MHLSAYYSSVKINMIFSSIEKISRNKMIIYTTVVLTNEWIHRDLYIMPVVTLLVLSLSQI